MRVLACMLAILSLVAAQKDPNYKPGHDVIVHLFEWTWRDIADECERFLGPKGYGGVQVSPIQEHVLVDGNPWFERYGIMSYKWYTRSGTPEEFEEMVRRCNEADVRIYVDAVLNHMTANYENATGFGGSTADTYNFSYPAVPYSRDNFHYPSCNVTNYLDPWNVRNCELFTVHDLNQTEEYVRGKIVDLLNKIINAGAAGFRIDAAKHMWPEDLKVIFSRLNNLSTEYFLSGARSYIYQEVIDFGGEAVSKYEYNSFGAVTEFLYGTEVSNFMNGNNMESLYWFVNFGLALGMLPSKDALVFIDNHDTQRYTSNILTYKSPKKYKMAVAFMLALNYGNPCVMSSFYFNNNDDSPPQDSSGKIISPSIYPNGSCGNGWVCEHRWPQISNMVNFRNAVKDTDVNNWWDNGQNQTAFCRGNAGFIAFNRGKSHLNQTLFVCVEPGTYCDVISGDLKDNNCTGKVVTVDQYKKARIQILTDEEDGVLAIHRWAKV